MTHRLTALTPKGNPAAPGFVGSDAQLIDAFRRGDKNAQEEFHERYAAHVYRILRRLIGDDADIADLHHDVYVRALRSLPKLQNPEAFKGWLTAIAVNTARTAIAQKRRRRWLWFLPPDEVPEVETRGPSVETREALRVTYAVLDELSVDDRVAFTLRFIDGMELTQVAQACGTSLASIKRRLARASGRFVARARKHPVLRPWLEEGNRWNASSNL